MKTLLEYITFVKGVEYLIVVAFCLAFIALWSLIHTREKEAIKKFVPMLIPLSLAFGGAAIMVNSYGNDEMSDAPAVSEAAVHENYSDGSSVASTVHGSDKWLKVNSSEYLAITYGPATEFHKVMSSKIACKDCHHNSGNEIRACRDCHDRPFNPHNSSMLGLKAAYHQLCISCHRGYFSGPDSCVKCHSGGTTAAASITISAPARPHQLTWETCGNCHKDGIPGGREEIKIVYHDNCLTCHTEGIEGAPKVPADHAGRTAGTCQGCHKPGGG